MRSLLTYTTSIFFLTVALLFLILLAPLSKPRIISVTVAEGNLANADLANQQIKITFSRPMNQKVTYQAITIKPEVDGKMSWSGNTLFFTVRGTLKSHQNYEIRIAAEAEDHYQKKLGQDHVFTLTTKKTGFVYLNSEGQLTLGDLEGKNQTISHQKNIRDYQVNQQAQLIIYSHQPTEFAATEMYAYHLDSGKTERVAEKLSGVITKLQLDAQGNRIFFFISPLADSPQKTISKIQSFNLNTRMLENLKIESQLLEATDFWVTPDGGTLLIVAENQQVILRSLLGKAALPIGKSLEYRGGTKNGDRLLFANLTSHDQNTPGILLFNGELHRMNQKTEYSETASISQDGMLVAYSYFPETNGKKIAPKGIKVIAWPDGKKILEKYDPNFSYELGKIAPDNHFLAVEEYTVDQLMNTSTRKYGETSKPSSAQLRFLNIATGQFNDLIIQGTELKWLQ